MAGLPYITAPGNIEKALLGIKSAATPEKVTQDFVKTILQIKGGSGNQVTSYLRKVGFVNADGSPSDLYKKFRNSTTAGRAAAEALKVGYAALYQRNEYMHKLNDADLRGLIIEETGQGEESSAVGLVVSCIKTIKKFANWDKADPEEVQENKEEKLGMPAVQNTRSANSASKAVGLNLSYTINLNLPATSDVAVFNAIFKSLKDNLLEADDAED